uniref:Glucosylceramidase n=1 Tax=Timema monikensis TaxID=170555 RepID=A0A7R9HQG7_9NEOP|nr:unnamed protein product [Timema monikensis]
MLAVTRRNKDSECKRDKESMLAVTRRNKDIELSADVPCAPRSYGPTRMVCVCNSTHCDTVDKPTPLPEGQFLWYTSNRGGLRFHKTTGSFLPTLAPRGVRLHVTRSNEYQAVVGFGGAFTDAAGINVLSLSPQAQDNLLKSYFSPEGLEFNIGRVPIAGCDFSTHTYSYDNVIFIGNVAIFAWKERGKPSERDSNFHPPVIGSPVYCESNTLDHVATKIPLIKRAQEFGNKSLLLLAGAWSPPPWMKTNNDYSGFGFLKEEYYQTWADYHIRFLDAYKKEGLKFWAVSTGNEPANGIIPVNRFNSLGWTPYTQRTWIAENLGPALRDSQHKKIKLLALDDQRFMLPWWVNIVMSDEKAAAYIDGVAVHWYWDGLFPASLLDYTHDSHPDKLLLATEACAGDKPWEFTKVDLGSWTRGEAYMEDIIQDMNHWVSGWVDWNLALDLTGGPNWARNFVDAAVIVNATADEFYKQPMFYALGHFSKFVPEGSVRVQVNLSTNTGIQAVAFRAPSGCLVIIFYNRYNRDIPVTISDSDTGSFQITVTRRSFNTILYW